MKPLLDVRGLTMELPTALGWVRPVNEVSLRVGAGECLGLVGESGSGKTLLSLALMGLLPTGARVCGEAWLEGRTGAGSGTRRNVLQLSDEEMRELRGREMAMIFQEPMTSLNPAMRVGAQVEEAIREHYPKMAAELVRKKMLEALRWAAVPEVEERARQYPHQLSGGLRQRVMIAMAIAVGLAEQVLREPRAEYTKELLAAVPVV
jgi:ABC-type glutathione transport system ATPase component